MASLLIVDLKDLDSRLRGSSAPPTPTSNFAKRFAKHTKESKAAIKFEIFKETGTRCCGGDTGGADIQLTDCQALHRVACALKYYQLLKIGNDASTKRIFTEFCGNVYRNMLDDFNHVLLAHNEHIGNIHNILINNAVHGACSIQRCRMFARHYFSDRRLNERANKRRKRSERGRDQNVQRESDARFLFFRELYDSAHCYLYHIFDVGLRSHQTGLQAQMAVSDDDDDDEDDDDGDNKDRLDIADHYVQRSVAYVQQQRQRLQSFDMQLPRLLQKRIHAYTNPYCLYTGPISQAHVGDDEKTRKTATTTFLDALNGCFPKNLEGIKMSHRLNRFLKEAEYDSDAVIADLMMVNGDDDDDDAYHGQSNIVQCMDSARFVSLIREYRKHFNDDGDGDHQWTQSALNTGFLWYYWSYYRQLSEAAAAVAPDDADYQNLNERQGLSLRDLFVTPKCDSFKQEMLTHVSYADYSDLVAFKAEMYARSERGRALWANDQQPWLHYDIECGAAAAMHHWMALIVYCDFAQVAAAFKTTFTRRSRYEALNSVKERHRSYVWMARYLREMVEVFGHCDRRYYYQYAADGGDAGQRKEYRWRRCETGPFYVAASHRVSVPSMSVRLCAPVSVTKSVPVVLHFWYAATAAGSGDGMLLQLQNNGHTWSKQLSMFDCSWIAKYKAEDTRLFMGGFERIRIADIYTLQQLQNDGHRWRTHQSFCHALYLFDVMFCGVSLFESQMRISPSDVRIIRSLLLQLKQEQGKERLDVYMQQCWQAYTQHKRTLVVNFNYLYLYFDVDALHQVVVRSLQRYASGSVMIEPQCNMLRCKAIFEIFGNVQKIMIYSTSMTGKHAYKFSLSQFLKVAGVAEKRFVWKHIKIIAVRYNDDCPSWLYYAWQAHGTQLQNEATQKHILMHLKQEKIALFGGGVQDFISIYRK